MFRAALGAAVTAVVAAGTLPASVAAGPPPATPRDALPVVFVHGQSGSAQQFETHAMRFTSNGYPQELLFAFEYDTSAGQPNPIDGLDDYVDEVLAETGADAVYAVGHSRGTSVWTQYLNGSADRAAKVAKYVNIDGATQATLPGGVPTIGIWGEWNTAGSGFNRRGDTDAVIGDPADNYYFADKSHTETATSAEAFALMYEFFTGEAPTTTDVVPEPPGQVSVAGRAVIFPENVGATGSTLDVWRVAADTGARIGARPIATQAIDASGDFGPVNVNGLKHYEFAVTRTDGSVHHFYPEPFSRTDHFLRLNTSRPDEGIEAFIPRSPERTSLVISRQREFWGDQGANSDRLLIDGIDLATPLIAPRVGVNLAMFAFDVNLDGVTDLDAGVPIPFNFLTFLTAGDIAIDASPDASGTVAVTDDARGASSPTTVNVPNWPSDVNRITVQFRDDVQQIERFPDRRGR
jgi:hypothetical protein